MYKGDLPWYDAMRRSEEGRCRRNDVEMRSELYFAIKVWWPFCVVICWSHRIYHCHLMEPSSWIIGTSRANFGVLPVIGCVCIISRTVHRFRPMSLWKLMMGVFDALRSPDRGWSSYSISVCQHGSFIGCTWCDRFEEVAEFGEVCRQSIPVRYVNLVPMLDHHYISLWHVLCVNLGNHARQSSLDGVRDVSLLY